MTLTLTQLKLQPQSIPHSSKEKLAVFHLSLFLTPTNGKPACGGEECLSAEGGEV